MRSPALDSLDSREMPYVLRKDKKLRYNSDGSNNLVKWIPDVIQLAKAAQPAFHRVLVDRAIPPEWETPFPAPDPAVYAAMDDYYERDCLRQQHEKTRQNWKICKPAFCTWLLANISDSSDKRVKEQEHAAFDAAKEGDACLLSSSARTTSTDRLRASKNRRTSVTNMIIFPGPAQRSYNTSSSAGTT